MSWYWEDLIKSIDQNPEGVLMTFYVVDINLPFGVRSKYIPIGNSELCCALGNQKCQYKNLGQIRSADINPFGRNIYHVLDLSRIDDTQNYIIQKPISELSISYQNENPFLQYSSDNYDCLNYDLGNLPDLRYIGSDSFTNELLIGIYLNEISEEYQLHSFPYYYEYGLCPSKMMMESKGPKYPAYSRRVENLIQENLNQENLNQENLNQENLRMREIRGNLPPIFPYQGVGFGLYLIEKYPEDTFSNFSLNPRFESYCESVDVLLPDGVTIGMYLMKSNILRSILGEVISTIELLVSLFYFSHGYLFPDNIKLIENEEADKKEENIKNRRPFGIRIVNISEASLTVNLGDTDVRPHRFYRRNRITEQLPPIFAPLNEVIDGISYYILDSSFSQKKYEGLRSIGVPFYRSFDLYLFFISLLLIPSYHYIIFGNKSMTESFWDPLWYPEDSSIVYNRIVNEMNFSKREDPRKLIQGAPYNIKTIISILRNIRLKCDLKLSDYIV